MTERRLVSFWAGGSVRKKVKAAKGAETPAEERAEALTEHKRGGKIKIKVVNKAKGGRMPKMAMPKMTEVMPPMAPTNSMEGRLTTGTVGRKSPGRRALPTIGGALGPLQ